MTKINISTNQKVLQLAQIDANASYRRHLYTFESELSFALHHHGLNRCVFKRLASMKLSSYPELGGF